MKKFFETPRRAVLSVLCVAAGLLVLGTGTAFAVNAIANYSSNENRKEKNVTATDVVNQPQQTQAKSGIMQPEASREPKVAKPNASQAQNQNGQISLDAAKEIALSDAGADASAVTFTKTKQGYDDGALVYEIEFLTKETEYEYEIGAADGMIRSKDAELRDMVNGQRHSDAQQSTASISEEQAKSIAASHAGFSVEEVIFKEVKLDYEDGLTEYEIEFVKDNREYEYKLNASNGEIVEYDVD